MAALGLRIRLSPPIRQLANQIPRPKQIAGQSMPSFPAFLASPYVTPILLLLGSNVFMTLAWYGHLRFKEVPLAWVIVASWLIAFVEYCMAVPANRFGNAVYTTAQLKT